MTLERPHKVAGGLYQDELEKDAAILRGLTREKVPTIRLVHYAPYVRLIREFHHYSAVTSQDNSGQVLVLRPHPYMDDRIDPTSRQPSGRTRYLAWPSGGSPIVAVDTLNYSEGVIGEGVHDLIRLRDHVSAYVALIALMITGHIEPMDAAQSLMTEVKLLGESSFESTKFPGVTGRSATFESVANPENQLIVAALATEGMSEFTTGLSQQPDAVRADLEGQYWGESQGPLFMTTGEITDPPLNLAISAASAAMSVALHDHQGH